MNLQQYDIDIMSKTIGLLRSLPSREQNDDYKRIVNMINDYLSTYCHHNICIDEIDIGVDQTKTIKYCEKCYLTFD